MNKLMITEKISSLTLQRKHKARMDHIEHLRQITQEALNANAEIHHHSLANMFKVLKEAELKMESFRSRHGENKTIEAVYQNWVNELQSSNFRFLINCGDKLLTFINNIPNEPRDVGFWQEIASRIKALLFDEGSSTQSILDKIHSFSEGAKGKLTSASRSHLQNLETLLSEMTG